MSLGHDQIDAGSLLDKAQHGDETALAQLFALYRSYLLTLARPQIHRRLQGKVDASDLAQEALLEAHKCFAQFRGETTREFGGWLRGILAHRLSRHVRRFFDAKQRDAKLERQLSIELEDASSVLDRGLVANISSPSQQAARRESSLMLADALESLPEDYRRVILLRHFEGQSFAAVADTMERSVDSVEKLWVRGIARLYRELGATLG